MKKKMLALTLAACCGFSLLGGCGVQTVESAGEASSDPGTSTTADASADTASSDTADDTSSDSLTGNGDKTINVFLYMQEHEKEIYKKLVEPEMSTHTVIAWLKNRTLSTSSAHLIRLFREMFLGERGSR